MFDWIKNEKEKLSLYHHFLIIVIFLGDDSVGKSSIISILCDEEVKTTSTIGIEMKTFNLNINDENLLIHTWDTSGQLSFRDFIKGNYSSQDCAIIVYSITSQESFKNLDKWLNGFRKENPNKKIYLIGNKLDLEDNRVVSTREGEIFAEKNNLLFYETSINSKDKIKSIFTDLSKDLLSNKK